LKTRVAQAARRRRETSTAAIARPKSAAELAGAPDLDDGAAEQPAFDDGLSSAERRPPPPFEPAPAPLR